MREVGVLEAKTHLSALLDDVEQRGESVAITRRGKTVAKLVPGGSTHDGGAGARMSGAELLANFKALRAAIEAEAECPAPTWEELKEEIHE